MSLAIRVNGIEFSKTIEIANKVRKLEKEGKNIINLCTGEPYLPTPECVKKATISALQAGSTYYSDSKGILQLREAISQHYNERFGVQLDPDKNILVTPGAKQALVYSLLSIVNPGDEVIITSPAWPSYSQLVTLSNGKPVTVENLSNPVDPFPVKQISQAITKNTKAILLNSPHNPTGRIIQKQDLSQLVALCKEKEVFLISDEIYGRIIFDKYNHQSLACEDPNFKTSILIDGFSKSYSMTGWRLGYMISSPEIIAAAHKLQQNTVTCPCTFVQHGAIEALKNGEDFIKDALAIYQINRDLIKDFCDTQNISLVEPQGGIYAFVDTSSLFPDSLQCVDSLLENYHIAVIPGVSFGKNVKEFIRITLATRTEKVQAFIEALEHMG